MDSYKIYQGNVEECEVIHVTYAGASRHRIQMSNRNRERLTVHMWTRKEQFLGDLHERGLTVFYDEDTDHWIGRGRKVTRLTHPSRCWLFGEDGYSNRLSDII